MFFYYIGNQEYGIALTIADNSYMGLGSVSVLDFKNDFCSIAAKTGQKIGSDIDAGKDTVKKLSGKVISEVLL